MELDTIGTMVEVTIADASHWEQVRALSLAARRENPKFYNSTLEEELGRAPESWADCLSNLSSRTFFIDSNQLCGTATLSDAGDSSVGILGETWVAPSNRANETGDLLIQSVIDYAVGFGYQRILSSVAAADKTTQALYQRHGFIITSSDSSLRLVQYSLTLPCAEFIDTSRFTSKTPSSNGLLN